MYCKGTVLPRVNSLIRTDNISHLGKDCLAIVFKCPISLPLSQLDGPLKGTKIGEREL